MSTGPMPEEQKPSTGHRVAVALGKVVAGAALGSGLLLAVASQGVQLGGLGVSMFAAASAVGNAMLWSVLGYVRYHKRVGNLTAAVAIAVLWGGCAFTLALISPSCPGGAGGRCTTDEAGAFMLSSFLAVLVPAVLVLPGWRTYKTVRAVVARLRRSKRTPAVPTTKGRGSKQVRPGRQRASNASRTRAAR